MAGKFRSTLEGVMATYRMKSLKRKIDRPGAADLRKKQPKSVTRAS